jgi:hypothetical protein
MIVQSAPRGNPEGPRFVIKNTEHQGLAGRIAEMFGNEQFAGVEPRAEMLDLIHHHDQGWVLADEDPGMDPDTGLPYHLVRTPIELIVQTSRRSPDYNEARGALTGLLSSMHTYGLYHGRYGLSDRISMDWIPAEARTRVDAMLEAERERQVRLRAELGGHSWATPQRVFHNYKLLQFFDTLALYFNLKPQGERGDTTFQHVPAAIGDDRSITVRESGGAEYIVDPWPFHGTRVEMHCEGRYLAPGQGHRFHAAPVTRQRFDLRAA